MQVEVQAFVKDGSLRLFLYVGGDSYEVIRSDAPPVYEPGALVEYRATVELEEPRPERDRAAYTRTYRARG